MNKIFPFNGYEHKTIYPYGELTERGLPELIRLGLELVFI